MPVRIRTPAPALVRRCAADDRADGGVLVGGNGAGGEVQRAAAERVAAAVEGDVADGLRIVDRDGGGRLAVAIEVGIAGARPTQR